MNFAILPIDKWIAGTGFHLILSMVAISLACLNYSPRALPIAQAMFLSLLAGYLNLLTTEPQLPAMLIFTGAAFASFTRPKVSWRWIPFFAIPVPAGECLKGLLNPFSVNLTAVILSFTAFLPAAIGVGCGITARKLRLRKLAS